MPAITVAPFYQFFGTRTLHGPADSFNNLTIAEFSDTEECLEQYETTEEELWLNRFISVMYRPAQPTNSLKGGPLSFSSRQPNANGDVRVPYNFHANDFIAVMVSRISPAHKAAIMLWYLGCRAEIAAGYKFIFQQTKGKKSKESGGFTDIIHLLAGPKFGTVEQTGRVLLKVALYELKLMHEANG